MQGNDCILWMLFPLEYPISSASRWNMSATVPVILFKRLLLHLHMQIVSEISTIYNIVLLNTILTDIPICGGTKEKENCRWNRYIVAFKIDMKHNKEAYIFPSLYPSKVIKKFDVRKNNFLIDHTFTKNLGKISKHV